MLGWLSIVPRIFTLHTKMEVTVLNTLPPSQRQAYRSALEVFTSQLNAKIQSLQLTVEEAA